MRAGLDSRLRGHDGIFFEVNIKGRLKTDFQAFRRPLPSFYALFLKHIFNNAHHAAGDGIGHLAVDLAADGVGNVVAQALP